MKNHIIELIRAALAQLAVDGVLPVIIEPDIQLQRSKAGEHGDLASNIALILAKQAGCAPRELAQRIVAAMPANDEVTKVEIAGPGFINFFLSTAATSAIVATILQQGAQFGYHQYGAGRKVQVEFVSANPTGPLHVGHGRGAAVGDSICRLLAATGWQVTREFYYNDSGTQIHHLAQAVQARCKQLTPNDAAWPEDAYRGEYIIDVARAYMAGEQVIAADQVVTGGADVDDLEAIRHFAVAFLRREQDADLKAFVVHFDGFFLESSLYTEGKVEHVVQQLIERGKTYQKDGALWLKTTDYGDDKDRVMRKRDGSYTYFVPDVAYHVDKWQRGYQVVIDELGADHHNTITRVRAGLQALDIGIPQSFPDCVLHQMVTVMRGGEEVKISKRAGSYVTLRDLIDEVGRDATRYFLVARAASSQLNFDIDLARSQSNDNPVYYIQYAHARVCSVMRQLQQRQWQWSPAEGCGQLALLTADAEKALLKMLADYPERVAEAASRFEPHIIAHYLHQLAADFHHYYNHCKILIDDANLRNARLALSVAVQQVIANGLDLLGVSAPTEM